MPFDPSHCGGKLLIFDQGCLHVHNSGETGLNVFLQSSECYECSLSWIFKVPPGSTKHAVVQTTSKTILELVNNYKFTEYFRFGQHGHYNISANDSSFSGIITEVPPDDAYYPLKVELWILFIIVALWSLGACTSYYLSTFQWLFQTSFARRELLNDLGIPSESSGDPVSLSTPERTSGSNIRLGRVQCIDAFRGLALILMVFVNYGGGKYSFFEHAPWNGLTFADVVFPSFAFVMGMSQLLSIFSLYRNTNSKKKVFLKIFLRSLVLISLGIIINSINQPNLLKLRLPGVLQRLGLAYFIVGCIEVICIRRHFPPLDVDILPNMRDWLTCCGIFQWILIMSLVVIHTCILFLVKVPGCPVGYIGPGGLHMNGTVQNCTGGASRYIDELIFSPNHMYNRHIKLYNVKVPFDPEGLLGTLTTAFTVFLGVCAVRMYLTFRSPSSLMKRWASMSLLCCLIAGELCNWSKEGGIIPINKRLWSFSFALANGSISFFTLFVLYFLIDYLKIWNGSPFKDVGKNSILIYIGHIMLKDTFPWAIAPLDMTTHTDILLLNTWSTFLWIGIADKALIAFKLIMDGAHCIPSPVDETCQSTAFTVTFESAKSTNNRFIKRHIRNLSLPVVKVYDHKVVSPSVNGNDLTKKPGNHSEGYFSSDPEDEHGNSKMVFKKHVNSPTKEVLSAEEEDENRSEGAPSEAGTYTIDKETPEVVTARLSIDTKFGVEAQGGVDHKEWISDWASRSQPGPSSASSLLPMKTKANMVSKIPSPISPRARLGSGSRLKKGVPFKPLERSRPNSPVVTTPKDELLGDNDTERYLKTTERAMTVLAARMSLSLDSGGESDTGESRRGRPLQRSDSSASESHNSRQAGSTSSTRYNRAFSLRRGRLEEPPKKIESPPVKPLTPKLNSSTPRVKPQQNCLSRTDVTRNSIRTPVQKSPQLSTPKTEFVTKKKPGPGGRSNSSLSSKEVEFQNWKRRKSYDPMKAAAEGKRKEAAAKRSSAPPPIMSQSSTNATTTPKSPVNSVLRSASFHTTQQLRGAPQSSSEEDEEEEEEDMTLSAEDWPLKIANQITVENVPGGSRGSLYSNNSSGGSPRQRKLEGIDNFIVSALATISSRVYTNTAIILNKLSEIKHKRYQPIKDFQKHPFDRFIFDEESEKYKELTAELELLEAGTEASTSPSKSTSRDLAVTLKNLKRLDSAVKVLNDVLFENIEYE